MNDRFFMGIIRFCAGIFLLALALPMLITHAVYAQILNGNDASATAHHTASLSVAAHNGTSAQSSKKLPATGNLGYLVNSRYDDLNPIVSAGGTTIYFARKHSIENVGGRADPQDIWSTSLTNGRWSQSVNLGPGVNSPKADNLCAVSPDEKTFYFFVQTGKHQGYFGYRQKAGSEWTRMQSTGLEIQNESPFLEASMAMNGTVILFTARNRNSLFRLPGSDERDIFVSLRGHDGSWSYPVNLGPMVNSSGDEYSPFLAADGRTLYFSTNGRPGIGGADIFMVRRTGAGWTEWTEPVNLGPEINTSGFDGYLTVPASGNVAYLATSRLSLGKADLVCVVLPDDLRPEKVTSIRGLVTNARTGREVQGLLSVIPRDPRDRSMEMSVTGEYVYLVNSEREVTIEVKAPGFITQRRKLVTTAESSIVEANFALEPLDRESAFHLSPIYFEEGKAELKAEALSILDSVSLLLKDNPALALRAEGHTDNRGIRKSLYELSRKRVVAVRHYLRQHGIDPKRVEIRALGPTEPIADNTHADSRARNRRVEFRLVRR